MQNDVVQYFDEVEPRRMPKPASAFDSRPFPTVPEVSLILEQQKKMDNSTENTIPQVKSSITRDASYKASESYTAWKEKQFPPRSTISPNRFHQIQSSTQNASTLQDSQTYRNSSKSYNPVDHRDCNTRNQSSENVPRTYHALRIPHDPSTRGYVVSTSSRDQSPNRYIPKMYEQFSNGNKYASNYSSNHRENNYHNTDNRINTQHYAAPRHDGKEGRISPLGEHPSHHLYERGFEVYDGRQRPRIYRSASFSNAESYTHRPMPIEEHDYESKHSKSLQPYLYIPEHSHSHSHSGCCSANHNNSNPETETVKNLLQVITSQNEQIKNLQKQVERLLKLHEQTLKERKQCTCQPNGTAYPNAQLYEQSRSTNVHNNFVKDSEKCFSDLNLQDEKNKKTILEQKVSIGVMTSFELKVQNNPSLTADNQNQSKQKGNQDKVLPSLDHTCNILKSLVNDTGEMIRKKKSNYFNPTPLENISEGSESHMSSFRQSHLCSDTTKQSFEAHDSLEVQNTEFCKQNSKQHQNMEVHSESRERLNGSSNNNHRNLDNLDYGITEPLYKDSNKNVQESEYQYNFQYDNMRSSPQENLQERQPDRFRSDEPLATDIKKMKNIRCDNLADECLSLSGSDLDVEDLSPPSPEPSIHLDIQEFSDEGGSLPPQQAPKPGWTLYNNVLDQVNKILQNSPLDDDLDQESRDGRNNKKREYDNNVIVDTVKAATLEQLTKLGISISDNADHREPPYNKRVVFDASSYQRQGPETQFTTTSASIETNTSMHMKALAMKYFNDEQLADFQKSRPNAMKQSSTGMQNTNMSFATMHYLQRYHLLPGTNSSPRKEAQREDYRVSSPVMNERLARHTTERREPSPHRYAQYAGTSKVSYPSKILDISTLKQQPKLL